MATWGEEPKQNKKGQSDLKKNEGNRIRTKDDGKEENWDPAADWPLACLSPPFVPGRDGVGTSPPTASFASPEALRPSFSLSSRSDQLQTAGSVPPTHLMSKCSRPRSARPDAHTAACASAILPNRTTAVAYLGGLCSAFLGDFMESTMSSLSTGPNVEVINVCRASTVVKWEYWASGYLRRMVVSCSPLEGHA